MEDMKILSKILSRPSGKYPAKMVFEIEIKCSLYEKVGIIYW